MENPFARRLMSNLFSFFQLFFDDYAETGRPDTFGDVSMPTETSETGASYVPAVSHPMEIEMKEVRHQLQLLKKQTMTALDQAKKSAEREQTALLQTQKSLDLEKAATSQAKRAAERENYLLDLMTDASEDMAGMLPFSCCPTRRICPSDCLSFYFSSRHRFLFK
jgi:hypothetical protein